MDALIYTVMSGAERIQRAQAVHANNLANMETARLPRQPGAGRRRAE